jgi:hypothetical protein
MSAPSGVPTPASVFQPHNATDPTDPEPVIPEANGKLVLRSVSGGVHEYLYKDMPKGWRPRELYLSISTAEGWAHWPWSSILHFETHVNDDEYVEAKQAQRAWRDRRREAARANSDCG